MVTLAAAAGGRVQLIAAIAPSNKCSSGLGAPHGAAQLDIAPRRC